MNAFTTHLSFEFRTGIRNKTLLLMNYLLPLGFYFLMAFIMPQINPTFQDDIIPAMVIFAVLAATLLGLPDPLVNARENGVFRSYKINGVPAASILSIPALTTVLHLTIVTLIIVGTAPLLFNAPAPVNWLNFVLTFVVFAFACAGISVLIAVISANSRITVLWSQLIFLPSMLLGGMMLPYHLLPETIGKIARILPATHAMNAFNSLAMGNPADFNPWLSLLVLFTGGIIAFAVALFLFEWDSHNKMKRNLPIMALLALVPYLLSALSV